MTKGVQFTYEESNITLIGAHLPVGIGISGLNKTKQRDSSATRKARKVAEKLKFPRKEEWETNGRKEKRKKGKEGREERRGKKERKVKR